MMPVSPVSNLCQESPEKQRRYWLDTMIQIVRPVLDSLANHSLKASMPLAAYPETAAFAPLEAFGRVSCGMAPWLELEGAGTEEDALREELLAVYHKALDAATNPDSPDRMVFCQIGDKRQALVDAAFLCHALVRAPSRILKRMDGRVKKNLVSSLMTVREIEPYNTNWVLFSAMVETGLYLLGDEHDFRRIESHVKKVLGWYAGDGVYGDGPEFRFDYYNSFVIHPMLLDITAVFSPEFSDIQPTVRARSSRYAAILERMISPEGAYPIVGRSINYRFGAFQLLSQAALQHFIPEEVSPAQVRCALTAVIQRVMDGADNFDSQGWLVPGVCGLQPELSEHYINTGSLYLCAAVFLALGLSPDDPFWLAPNEQWTSRKVFHGMPAKKDAALEE
ncbi:MAG: DUF2264 domain-containing protein [Treponema sp.]|nr:DUF2264 domain-containing protein [Treponema sp.]